jgi:hypothetical protein
MLCIAAHTQVRVVLTASGRHFLERCEQYDAAAWPAWLALTPPVQVLSDEDEWSAWNRVGDAVVHIQVIVLPIMLPHSCQNVQIVCYNVRHMPASLNLCPHATGKSTYASAL